MSSGRPDAAARRNVGRTLQLSHSVTLVGAGRVPIGMEAALSEGPPVTFRGKIFLALALVGCAPLVLLGWQTVGVNRAELTRAVGNAQASTARAAASGCEKMGASPTSTCTALVWAAMSSGAGRLRRDPRTRSATQVDPLTLICEVPSAI